MSFQTQWCDLRRAHKDNRSHTRNTSLLRVFFRIYAFLLTCWYNSSTSGSDHTSLLQVSFTGLFYRSLLQVSFCVCTCCLTSLTFLRKINATHLSRISLPGSKVCHSLSRVKALCLVWKKQSHCARARARAHTRARAVLSILWKKQSQSVRARANVRARARARANALARLSVCVYVCMCVCMCVCVCVLYIYIYIYTCICEYEYICLHAYVCIHMYE